MIVNLPDKNMTTVAGLSFLMKKVVDSKEKCYTIIISKG